MTHDELAELEATSIRLFVLDMRAYFEGASVLDYGCGKQPYRDIVEDAGGQYTGFDDPSFRGSVVPKMVDVGFSGVHTPWWQKAPYDVVLTTQVIQYVPGPLEWLGEIHDSLVRPRGVLLLTYPTTWPEIRDDLWRFTREGMEYLLRESGFRVVHHTMRADLPMGLSVGGGVAAWAWDFPGADVGRIPGSSISTPGGSSSSG